MENTPTPLKHPMNTPLTQLDTVVDSPHVLLSAAQKGGVGTMELILLSVFHSCFPCTLLRECFTKTAFWVRE